MGNLRAVPFQQDLLTAAAKLCADGIRRGSTAIAAPLDRPDAARAPELAETMLRGFLAEQDGTDRTTAWAVLDEDDLIAFGGALVADLSPDDARYTYMPPKSITLATSALHAESEAAADAAFPLLLDELRREAASMGGARLFVNVLPSDTASAVWLRLGLRPASAMAWREAASWHTPNVAPSAVRVRVAGEADIEALTDLALEEHHFHAGNTGSGVSPDQPRATSRRVAADSVAAASDGNRQLVACDGDGRVVGSVHGTIQQIGDDARRFLLPPRYGYIGLTSVTAAARGTGVGRTLVGAVMSWFADRDIDMVFLHYAVDNPLSARFWTRAGFVPHIDVYGVELP